MNLVAITTVSDPAVVSPENYMVPTLHRVAVAKAPAQAQPSEAFLVVNDPAAN